MDIYIYLSLSQTTFLSGGLLVLVVVRLAIVSLSFAYIYHPFISSLALPIISSLSISIKSYPPHHILSLLVLSFILYSLSSILSPFLYPLSFLSYPILYSILYSIPYPLFPILYPLSSYPPILFSSYPPIT